MRKILLLGLALTTALILGVDVTSISSGIFPNTTVVVNQSNVKVGSLTRVSSASCGGNQGVSVCHRTGPFLTKVTVSVGDHILAKNGSTTITVAGANSGVPGTRGGFCADVTLGSVVAGTNTQIDATGSQITHKTAYLTGRQWSFGLKAGTKTGLGELYTVVNCVNGNGYADGGDEWSLHSSKILASQTTPVRYYVNADGVKSNGAGCVDGHGNQSVLGAPQPPTVGNANFVLEAYGLPPSSQFLFMMSVGGNVPGFDMAPLGAPGCVLRTTLQYQVIGPTSGGDAVRGEGKVILPVPIPNDANLRGLVLSIQIGALDNSQNSRLFPLVVTNGIEMKIQ